MSTFFNFPPGRVRISFGIAGDDDKKNEFRIGVIKGDQYREHKKSWMGYDTLSKVSFAMPRDEIDKIYIEKRDKESKEALERYSVNIKEKWPENASGATSVVIDWWF